MKATSGQIAFLKAMVDAMADFDDVSLCMIAGEDLNICFNTLDDCDCRKAIKAGIDAYERDRDIKGNVTP